jgi:hypothetical protein
MIKSKGKEHYSPSSKFGYCNYHAELIDETKFEWKDCWACYHFKEGDAFPYIDVEEAVSILKVSPSTIRRWIKIGKLKGRLFVRRKRRPYLSPPHAKYFIQKSSVEALANRGLSK